MYIFSTYLSLTLMAPYIFPHMQLNMKSEQIVV